MNKITIRKAKSRDASIIIDLVHDLLNEIMTKTGQPHFSLATQKGVKLLKRWLRNRQYTVLLAEEKGHVVGCLSLVESFAIYVEGAYGIIPELYISPKWRSQMIGERLLTEADQIAVKRGWCRLELTTPPLPEFDRTRAFYLKCGFEKTGGHKMKRSVVAVL